MTSTWLSFKLLFVRQQNFFVSASKNVFFNFLILCRQILNVILNQQPIAKLELTTLKDSTVCFSDLAKLNLIMVVQF